MSNNSILLQQARDAYHRLQIGTSARVVVDIDGSRVEYTAANSAKLYTYIQQLQAAVNAEKGLPTVADVAPAQFIF